MSKRFEDSIDAALEWLASIEPKTVDKVRASIDTLPQRRPPRRLGMSTGLLSYPARLVLVAASVVVVAAVAVSVAPWISETPSPMPTGTSPSSPANSASPAISPSPSSSPGAHPTFTDPGGAVIDMQRVDATFGWALLIDESTHPQTYTLMTTDDAGATWRNDTPAQAISLLSVDFLDRDHGWALQAYGSVRSGAATVWRTTNGGGSWSKATLQVNATLIQSAVLSFADTSTGYILLNGGGGPDSGRTILYATTDGGSSWKRLGTVPVENLREPPERPLVFLTRGDGLLGDSGLQTHDGGRSWTAIDLPMPENVPADGQVISKEIGAPVVAGRAILLPARLGWTSPGSAGQAQYEFISRDLGRTWTLAWPVLGAYQDWNVAPVNDQTWFRFPDYSKAIPSSADWYSSSFSVTRNGGLTWTTITPTLPSGSHFALESLVSASDGWAVLSPAVICPVGAWCPAANGNGPGQLVETTDGGVTWFAGTR